MKRNLDSEAVRRKYDQNARWFDAMDRMIKAQWRQLIIGQATGRVLEIGVGSGKNLEFYDPAVTTDLIGIDLSPGMLALAKSKPCAVPNQLLEMNAQQMSFEDDTFDTVLATCVFCTVPDPILGLQEARRVCKPNGQILLLEHVRIDRPIIGPLMDLLDPLMLNLIGTHINRRTVENVRAAGLQIQRIDPIRGNLIKLIQARP